MAVHCRLYITFSLGIIMKEYEMILLKYNGKACRLYLLFDGVHEDIIL